MVKVLVAEDEPFTLASIRAWLPKDQYHVQYASQRWDVDIAMRERKFDLILLSLSLVGVDIEDMCKRFRAAGGTALLLVTTARESFNERERILDAGADDYVSKPLAMRDLLLRFRTLLRRASQCIPRKLHVRDIVLIPEAGTVSRNGEQLHLSPMELNLLEFFMRHPDVTFSVEALWERVWDNKTAGIVDTVRTHIKTLRQKIDYPGLPSIIETVRGRGYKLQSFQFETRPIVALVDNHERDNVAV